ncbi:Uncharacterized conserved protein YndB, AHSA1/START domain [Roseomonas rosea]|uniref:Uncharacterized conserved protein YndB, AHSA1/START domain n=1 Tax=Muricoccus roseus TaxID=198092 RepID=A0A1M6Q630_9PROT|nr:SRPBCC domain-containing protein [Roseomonas rosea]SHK15672.1 Uncharacterized conserved protein YndB, AHSA1/START domain [Roseomonas rosea]
MSMAASDGEAFVLTRVFAAPRARVWDAWTRPEMLARWFGPRGTTNTVLRSELRPGGLLHFRLDMPDGGRMWGRFVYRAVEAPRRLVWVHSFADEAGEVARAPFPGEWPLEMLNTVTFEEAAAGTEVTLHSVPIGGTAEERRAFEAGKPSMQEGWGGSFGQLDLFLAGQG